MTIAEFLHQFWWLIFPIFGMVMAFQGANSNERRTRDAIALIKTYTDQGKEPPPELLALVSKRLDWSVDATSDGSGPNDRAWTFVIFAGLAAGFGVGWYTNQTESYAFAFLMVAVAMGVMAVGALLILLLGRK